MAISITTRVLEYREVWSGSSVVTPTARMLSTFTAVKRLPDVFFYVRRDERQALNKVVRYGAYNN